MRLLSYLKRRAALLDELETLRRQNADLAEALETERIRSWMRLNPSPKALLLPDQKNASKRVEPHPVRAGRHRVEPVTENFPRTVKGAS